MYNFTFTPGVIGWSEYLTADSQVNNFAVMLVQDMDGYVSVFGSGSQSELLEELTLFIKSDGNSTSVIESLDIEDLEGGQERLYDLMRRCEIKGNIQDPIFAAMLTNSGFVSFDSHFSEE